MAVFAMVPSTLAVRDFNPKMTELVDGFVEQVASAARQAATTMLEAAVAAANEAARSALAKRGTHAPTATSLAMTPSAPARPAAPTASTTTRPAPRARGEKRPSDQIAQLQSRVRDFIRVHPGLRIEEINDVLGTKTRDLALPLRKLIADGVVRIEGEKRSTRYYPAGAIAPKAAAAPVAPRRRARA